jgi:hypothetical protein
MNAHNLGVVRPNLYSDTNSMFILYQALLPFSEAFPYRTTYETKMLSRFR